MGPKNHTRSLNTLCGKIRFLYIIAFGTRNYHWGLNSYNLGIALVCTLFKLVFIRSI